MFHFVWSTHMYIFTRLGLYFPVFHLFWVHNDNICWKIWLTWARSAPKSILNALPVSSFSLRFTWWFFTIFTYIFTLLGSYLHCLSLMLTGGVVFRKHASSCTKTALVVLVSPAGAMCFSVSLAADPSVSTFQPNAKTLLFLHPLLYVSPTSSQLFEVPLFLLLSSRV